MTKKTAETNGDTLVLDVFDKRLTGKKVTAQEAEEAVDALAEKRPGLLKALAERAACGSQKKEEAERSLSGRV